MKVFKYIKSVSLVVLTACILTTSAVCIEEVLAQPTAAPAAVTSENAFLVRPLDIVNNPKLYLNKNVTMKAKFDKFSTLGLDYKQALRSSEDYISFLIKRDDTSFNIPLSEMKLFMKRSTAEKFIELKTDDEIEIKGNVFSNALGDPWVDVSSIKILNKAPESKKN